MGTRFRKPQLNDLEVYMDVLLMILYAALALGFLVMIHEAGHYFASRAFGVRVTEFMIGMPGPSIGFTKGETRFGVTPFFLGGYAKVCGMEAGQVAKYIKEVLALSYTHGTVDSRMLAETLAISEEDALEALDELCEWGCLVRPREKDVAQLYKTRPLKGRNEKGAPIAFDSAEDLYAQEASRQFRFISFWKKTVILLAGVAVNILCSILLFVLCFSVLGVPMPTESGATELVRIGPVQAVVAGMNYLASVFGFVLGLFNPVTTGDTLSNGMSVVGIAVVSKEYAEMGFSSFLLFMSMISASLGVMNLLPIPLLDGGRWCVELYQRIRGKIISVKASNILSVIGLSFFGILFVVLVGQDILRIATGALA